MTVIVWDGVTLAADKQACVASQIYPVTKIHRIDADRLAAVSGALGRANAIIDWIRANGDPSDFPAGSGDDDYVNVMVVHRDGRIEVYENRAQPFTVDRATHCIGTGRDFGISALHFGCNAVQAVEHASQYSADCGLGVDTLRFDNA